jgi:hypothetical protein
VKSYPSDQGGYTEGSDPYATYHSWAATEYKAKVGYIGGRLDPGAKFHIARRRFGRHYVVTLGTSTRHAEPYISIRTRSSQISCFWSFGQSGTPGAFDQKSQNEGKVTYPPILIIH